jgi:hypothetical protein
MKNLPIVGNDSPAKVIIFASMQNYLGNTINLSVSDFFSKDVESYQVFIYIADEEPDVMIINRLRAFGKLVILIAARDISSDLFIHVAAFENCVGALLALQKIVGFLKKVGAGSRSGLPSELSEIHWQVLDLYCAGKSEAEMMSALHVSKRKLYSVLVNLRQAYGVDKNRQLLTVLSRNSST